MSGVRPAPPRSPLETRTSAFVLAAIGCLGIAAQLILLRELMAAYGGNELSAGVTVAAWILCEAFGAWLASRRPLPALDSLLPTLSILFSLAAVPAAVLVRPVLGILPGETLSIPLLLLATFAVVFPPAAAHGALFVAAAAHRTQGIGSAYIWEGIGTALAGLACFLLLNRLPSLAIIALFSFPLAAALFLSRPLALAPRPSPLVPLLLSAVAIGAFAMALPIERMAWSGAWRGQLVAAVANSPYGKIVRLQREGQQLVLYDGLPVIAVPPTQTERTEEISLLPVLIHPAPRRVLVLGSDLVIPAALARFRPDVAVTAVQLDPLLARACVAALSSDSSFLPARFSLITADPVSFLRTEPSSFDCIILTDDTPSSLIASRLFSLEFYRLCRSRLAPGGLLAVPGPGNPSGLSPDVVNIISTRQRTLEAAFGHVLTLAADFPLLLASGQPLNVAAETMVPRLAALSRRPLLLDSSYVAGLLDSFRQGAFTSQLVIRRSPPAIGTSSAASPHELFLQMVRENRLVSPAFGTLYSRLDALSPRLLVLAGALLLLIGLVGAHVRGSAFGRGLAILTSGFSGAAVSSLLIFAWQVRFGSVFSGIALLVAVFMLGSVLGAGFGTRRSFVRRSSSLAASFAVSDVALASCAAAVLALIRGGPAELFISVNCITGACLGFQFAVAASLPAGRRWSERPLSESAPVGARHSAGVLTTLDLVGGSLGGILTALVLVPVLGIDAAALCAGAVKLASALVQLVGAAGLLRVNSGRVLPP